MNRLILILMLSGLSLPVYAVDPDPGDWSSVERQASGQALYFNAWAGEARINQYLVWVADQLRDRFDIDMRHVKLSDTAQAVSRVVAEKQAGNIDNGSVDIVWINGENFAALKQNDLLFGPWAEQLPNFSLVDADRNADMRTDFTVAVDGLESPWTRSQLVFYYDADLVSNPPGTIMELLSWTKDHPGEFTYPRPPGFLGTTFLKQAVLELTEYDDSFYRSVEQSDFDKVIQPLWGYLDALHPNLLRSGRFFPAGGAELRQLMGDGELSLAFSFSPSEAVTGIADGQLLPSTRSYVLENGTIANVSFLAIPFNATHKAAAMVLANFLLSAEAQARAHNPQYMGSATVLAMSELTSEQRRLFSDIEMHPAMPSSNELSRKLQDMHPSWMPAIEQAWLQRYSAP